MPYVDLERRGLHGLSHGSGAMLTLAFLGMAYAGFPSMTLATGRCSFPTNCEIGVKQEHANLINCMSRLSGGHSVISHTRDAASAASRQSRLRITTPRSLLYATL